MASAREMASIMARFDVPRLFQQKVLLRRSMLPPLPVLPARPNVSGR
jgi:hypothetical protein